MSAYKNRKIFATNELFFSQTDIVEKYHQLTSTTLKTRGGRVL